MKTKHYIKYTEVEKFLMNEIDVYVENIFTFKIPNECLIDSSKKMEEVDEQRKFFVLIDDVIN